MARWMLHVDLDRFMASVEVLRHPELAGQPVVVGGYGGQTERGTVASVSSEARAFGIRGRMSLRSARRRCPDAIFLPVDIPACLETSQRVMDLLRGFGGVVQAGPLGEASMTTEADDPERLAREIQRAVRGETGLRCTIGIGDTQVRARTASDLAPTSGVSTLTRTNWADVMDGRAPDALAGVDRGRAAKLRARGIRTVSELVDADPLVVADLFGPRVGAWLQRIATGEDPPAAGC